MPTYPIVTLLDGDELSPEWVEDITDGVNDLDTRTSTIESAAAASTEAFGTVITTSTGTEAFHITHTFTSLAGARYRVEVDAPWQGNAAGALIEFRLRYQSGASVTSAGTLIRIVSLHAPRASENSCIAMSGTFAPGAGQFTVGFSIRWNNGGTNGSVNFSGLAVARLGLDRVI